MKAGQKDRAIEEMLENGFRKDMPKMKYAPLFQSINEVGDLVDALRAGRTIESTNFPQIAKRLTEKLQGEKQAAQAIVGTVKKLDSTIVPAGEAAAKPTDKAIVRTEDVAAKLEQFPSAYEFSQLLGSRKVGSLPHAMLGSGISEEQTFEKLDNLAKMLRSFDAVLPPQKKFGLGAVDMGMPDFKFELGAKTVNVHKVDIGEVAHVYKLSAGGQDFAFKVPNDPARMDVHGTYAETGAFVFFSKENVGDISRFHAANPSPSGGWILTEFNPVSRPGVTLNDSMAKNHLVLGDTWGFSGGWGPNRSPGGAVWDLGGIEPQGVPRPTNLASFRELLETRDGRMMAGRRVDRLTDPSQFKSALMLSLDYSEPAGQVARSAARGLRNPADLSDVLDKALETPGAAGRAAFELDSLKGTQYINRLFYKGLSNPESRIGVTQQIDKLAPEDRRPAIYTAFRYPDARPMATRAIPSLTDSIDRAQATRLAQTDPGSQYILLKTQAADLHIPPHQIETALNSSLDEYLRINGLKMANDKR